MTRALDALVAERIMGWRLIRHTVGDHHGSHTRHDWFLSDTPDEGEKGYWRGFTVETYPRPKAPGEWSPSSDISAAFAVVEAMRAMGWEFTLLRAAPRVHRWVCVFSRTHPTMGGPNQTTGDDAHSASLAICLAALRALGVPDEEIENARKEK